MLASALGPMGALEVSTLHGAHFIGAEIDLGSISAGKLADLVVLNSNPLARIRNTADIKYVMKSGVLYDAGSLDQLWPKRKPFEYTTGSIPVHRRWTTVRLTIGTGSAEENISHAKAQRKPFRNAVALCSFAPLRE